MVHWLVVMGLGYLAGEAYDKLVPEETKRKWQDFVKSHHGEWGVLGTIVGVATGHYGMAATSAGLALHDLPDREKWFTGDKDKKIGFA